MNIYFFSSHEPDAKMISELGAPITAQFKGCVSDIHTKGEQISFTETLYIGGQTIKSCLTIPKGAIVVVEAPPVLQKPWLDAGVHTLLIPQVKQETGAWGSHSFKYCGLLQVHKIEVVTSPWSGNFPSDQAPEMPIESSAQPQAFRVAGMPPVAHLFQRLRWKSAQQAALH